MVHLKYLLIFSLDIIGHIIVHDYSKILFRIKNKYTQGYSNFVKKPDNFSILQKKHWSQRSEVKLCDRLTPNLVYMLGSL